MRMSRSLRSGRSWYGAPVVALSHDRVPARIQLREPTHLVRFEHTVGELLDDDEVGVFDRGEQATLQDMSDRLIGHSAVWPSPLEGVPVVHHPLEGLNPDEEPYRQTTEIALDHRSVWHLCIGGCGVSHVVVEVHIVVADVSIKLLAHLPPPLCLSPGRWVPALCEGGRSMPST